MSRTKSSSDELRLKAVGRIHALQEQIAALDYFCSGSLVRRMKQCGKPSCRCATDAKARHGPYYEWSRLEKGRMVHRVLSPDQAELIKRAIANHRTIRRLLRRWEAETLRAAGVKEPGTR